MTVRRNSAAPRAGPAFRGLAALAFSGTALASVEGKAMA